VEATLLRFDPVPDALVTAALVSTALTIGVIVAAMTPDSVKKDTVKKDTVKKDTVNAANALFAMKATRMMDSKAGVPGSRWILLAKAAVPTTGEQMEGRQLRWVLARNSALAQLTAVPGSIPRLMSRRQNVATKAPGQLWPWTSSQAA